MSDRLDEPAKLSLGMVASLQNPLPFHLAAMIVPRIVIGEAIFEQPAGGGIGAVGVGSPCGYGGHGRSCPGREKNGLDPARSRLWSATSKSTTSRLAWVRSGGVLEFCSTCVSAPVNPERAFVNTYAFHN
jgi:hypothetical protein